MTEPDPLHRPFVRHPVHAALAAVPAVCFPGALITDAMYAQSPDMQWANFSAWLLFAGVGFGVLAAIAAIVDHSDQPHLRRQRPARVRAVGGIVVLVLALLNNFVHSRDAWTSVVPDGLLLSALTVLAMIVTVVLARPKAERLPQRKIA